MTPTPQRLEPVACIDFHRGETIETGYNPNTEAGAASTEKK
jgi:hypothetical protein